MRKFYLFLLSLFIIFTASSQAVNTYSFSAFSGNFIPIVGGTSAAGVLADDANSTAIPIGFTFTYAGLPYTSVTANSNGYLTLNAAPTSDGGVMRTNNFGATAAGLHPLLAPYWDDLEGGSVVSPTPSASYVTTGSPGSRVFTFQWLNYAPYVSGGTSATLSFQVKLYEGTNIIQFIYRQESGSQTPSASIGISSSATDFISLGNTSASPTTSTTTSTNTIATKPATGQVYQFGLASGCVGAPNPGVITGGISQSCANQPFTLNLTGSTFAANLTYQWFSSTTSGGPFTPISGATGFSYTSTGVSQTTYYQATVTCGGNTSTTAQFVVTPTPGLAGGVYTINSGLATGGTNFQTFAAAINAMSCGINGAVVFNVSGGPFVEQVRIPEIFGASATNTVTFNGNNSTLQFTPASGARYILQLDGADFVVIKKFNIVTPASATFGWGVHLINGANSNIIDSCTINISTVTSTTQSNSGGIIASGSNTSVLTAGNYNSNLIRGNTIIGAYQGISLYGGASPASVLNNTITGNQIRDFYARGIILTQTDGTIVSFNNIHRTNRTDAGGATFAGIELASATKNSVLNGNSIHDTHTNATAKTGDAYGIYFNFNDAPTGSQNTATNNIVYKFNSVSGAQYAIYNAGSDGTHIYHNSVLLDEATSTSGSTYGFYQTTSAINVNFRNNNVVVTRAGSGNKRAVYFATTTSTIVSNNNNLYVAGTNASVGQLGTASYATLPLWIAGTFNTYDVASISVDPNYQNPSIGNLFPNNGTLANAGASVGVSQDIRLQPRNAATPTIGAYEIIPSAGADVGIKRIAAPLAQSCYASAETVRAVFVNYSTSVLNLALNPVTVSVSATGPNATTFAPIVVNTGTLAAGDSLNVLISSSYNMTAPGTYVFSASATVGGDVNTANDGGATLTRVVTPLAVGTASTSNPAYCVTGGTPTINLTGSTGGNVQFQESATGLAGSFVNVGTGGTSYTPATAIAATRYYRAYSTCNGVADTSNIVTVALNTPSVVTTAPATRCGPGTATLSATPSSGSTLKWYSAATGGQPLVTGNSYTTPLLFNTTTYYVSASSGSGSSDVGLSPTASNCGGAPTSSTLTDWPLRFDVAGPITINSAYVIPAEAGTFTVALRASLSAVNIQTWTFTFTAAQVGVPQQISFGGYSITTPGSYQFTNTVGGIYRVGTFTCNYPYTSPQGNFSVVGSATFSTSATSLTQYNSFYQINISETCETSRTPVAVTITPAPAFDITNDLTVCNNSITTLQVNSSIAAYNTFVWTPVAGLFTNPPATTPYTAGNNASIIFAQNAAPGVYTYYATANNTTTGCQNIDSVRLTVLPVATVVATPASICVSGTTVLSASPATGYGTATFQWYTSPNGTTYTPITGATSVSYTTPTLTTTTFYRLEIKNSSGVVCSSPSITVNVNNPQILTTTPAALCGPGTLTIGGTVSTGATLYYYADQTGGVPIASGATYTTPNLTASTTYYVAAQVPAGNGPVTLGAGANTSTSFESPYYHLYGGKRSQYLVRASELASAGVTAGNINSVAFDVVTAGITYNSFRISMKQTNVSALTATLETGLSTVFPPTNVTPVVGINTYNFTPVFAWNGTSNIIVEVCWSNVNGGGTSASVKTDPTPFVSHSYYRSDSETPATVCSATTAIGTQSIRPKMIFNAPTYCSSPRVAVLAQVSGITTITAQPTVQATCAGSAFTVAVTATGANLTYQWRLNGTNIAGATSASYTVSTATAANAGTYDVVINGLCGNVTSNAVAVVVAAANSWLGTTSTDWNNPANWCGGIPTSTTDVVINASTPFQPVINATLANVRNLTVNNGATLSVASNGTLSVYGNLANNGTFTAPAGFVFFKGAAAQTSSALSAGTVLMNNTGGLTLTGNMTVGTNLILAAGNITLGANNLTLTGTADGSIVSHVVTNGTGSVITNNVTAATINVPVGPDATNYNPVRLNNGQGRNFTVRVVTGHNPAIPNGNRAVNRTWTITPNSAVSNVGITFQYADADINSAGSATTLMEVGVHNGTQWNIIAPFVTPSGPATAREVTVTTSQFGPMIVGNVGSITNPTAVPSVDPTVTKIMLLPNLIQSTTTLRVSAARAMKVKWMIVDANGRTVMNFDQQVLTGQNDLQLYLSRLASGAYYLVGATEKGRTDVVRFVKM